MKKSFVASLVFGGASLAALAAAGGFFDPLDTDSAATAQQSTSTANPQRRDTPDDPDYDCAELDTLHSNHCSNLYDERFDLFGFPSSITMLTALYADPTDSVRNGKPQVSGYNAAGAWKIETGRPDVTVAILDTGIRWDKDSLRKRVYLNPGELPIPNHNRPTAVSDADPAHLCPTFTNAYDANGDGVFNIVDYTCDDRVNPADGPHGSAALLDAEDLIVNPLFANHVDNDNNGYIDDIAGWNFFDDNNNPADLSSYFAASNHGSGRAEEAVETGNDGAGSIGICPRCSYMPIRVWDTFVADANNFGLAVTFATDNGVDVIEGADGGLYHSAFMEAASEYAWKKGAVQTYSGDDLNTGNHNYPANYTHAMLIEGTVQDNVGLGTDSDQFQQGRDFFCVGAAAAGCPGSNLPVQTYFRGANTTQFGGKSSISMWGATGSANTGRASGAAAIVVSAGLDYATRLSPDEVREILEQTAEDVTQPNTVGTGNPDFAQTGWDSHFGWGRVNLGAAVQAVKDHHIPPEAVIITPDWYEPVQGATVSIGGLARASRVTGGVFHWKLEWGTGMQPSSWTTAQQGDASSGTVTNFGTIDLTAVRTALATFVPPADPGDATFAPPPSHHPLQDQFTVRLTVTAGTGNLAGVDRKVLTALPATGQNLVAGYPKRMGSGGEAPLRYADLNGDNVQELIVPTEDGAIHAYRANGTELTGWPVHTDTFPHASAHLTAPAFATHAVPVPLEPPRGATIADLDQDGHRQVVTAAGVHLYVFNEDGSRRFAPVKSDDSFCTPDKQKQENLHPKCGFLATPAIAWINGRTQKPAIVEPALDGHLYVWDADGVPVSWSPMRLQDPGVADADKWVAESINNPAIGDLNGDDKDDIVVGTNEVYPDPNAPAPPVSVPGNPADVGFGSVSTTVTPVYAVSGTGPIAGANPYLPGWPIHVGGIIQDILPFIGPGHDAAIGTIGGSLQIVTSATGTGLPGVGSGLATYDASGAQVTVMHQDGKGAASNITDASGGINLFESAVIADLLGTGATPAIVKYQLGAADATNLLLVGQNNPYNHMIGAWDASTGTTLPAWPTITDDFQFLSSSTVAKISATGPTLQVLAGTGLGLLHAYDGATGLDVTGFPKVTGGWLFAPAAISDAGHVAAITREGFLFEWQVDQPLCQPDGAWPSFRHDQQGSGNYDRDGTPPGAIRTTAGKRSATGAASAEWIAPGDDGLCGTATHYLVGIDGAAPTVSTLTPAASGTKQTLDLSALDGSAHTVVVQAVDEVGNVGYPVSISIASTSGGGGGGGGGGPPSSDGGGGAWLWLDSLVLALGAALRRRRRT